MKTINKFLMVIGLVAAMVSSTTSCVNDLDLTPTDPSQITAGDFDKDPEGYMNRVMADVYLLFATGGANGSSPIDGFDGGMATFQRAIFIGEELTTDEASWLWDPDKYGTINAGYVTASTPCLMGFYYRLMINITLCNDFIQTVNEGRFNLNAEQMKLADEYIRQCKILRSACYFYYMNFFGDVPYADENTAIGATPPRSPRAEVFNLVTSTLEDVVSYYKENNPQQKPAYGFVGLDVAESLLVKFYLNAGVFTGTPAYDKCYAHAKAVIDRLGHGGPHGNGLANKYCQLFGQNNDQYAIGGSNEVNEIIWTIPQNYPMLTGYAGATFLTLAWLGTNGVEVTAAEPVRDDFATDAEYDAALAVWKEATSGDNAWKKTVDYTFNGTNYAFDPEQKAHVSLQWYNVSDGWKCMVARESFVKKFEWNDAAMSESDDDRVALWCTSAKGFTSSNPTLTGDKWGENGYLAAKFSNWAYDADGNIDNSVAIQPTGVVGGDYPAIRLAEIYLSAAEAIMEGGAGSQTEALTYVNYIRERAGLQPLAALSLSALRDERCRELYQENTRRTDLIRYNQWCTGYNWEWKGGVALGTALPEYTKIFPLPTDIIVASGYKQNPGY